MPAGVGWVRYFAFSTTAFLSMIMGSQAVHLYYKPLTDLNKYVDQELQHLPEQIQNAIREELKQEGILH